LVPPAYSEARIDYRNGIRHVLLISIDGMHALDYENCVHGGYCPNLEDLGEHGVNYTRTSTSRPSDSFPGLMALVTGGTPRSVGAFYDVAYDRVLAPPQKLPVTEWPGATASSTSQTTQRPNLIASYLPFSESPLNPTGIGPTEDDISQLWLSHSSDRLTAVGILEANATAAGIGQIFYGPSLETMFNAPGLPPLGDSRTPDIMVQPNVGEWFTPETPRNRGLPGAGDLALFALEDERDRLALRPYDTDHHVTIRGQRVAFESNRSGFRGGHFQDVVIPFGLAFEVFAAVNRGVVLAVGDVAVEEGLGGAFIHETARDNDDTLPIGDRHSTGLNDGLAGKIALGGYQRPSAVQGAVVVCEGGECAEEGRQDGSCDGSS
jgi:Type I phosphodiesterase / nucleotide pyrophosphatase